MRRRRRGKFIAGQVSGPAQAVQVKRQKTETRGTHRADPETLELFHRNARAPCIAQKAASEGLYPR
jgi:hypothetical protein